MFTKKHLAVLMLAAGGLASGSAWAEPQPCSDYATVGAWATATEGCIDQDKVYMWESFSGTSAPLEAANFGVSTLVLPGIDIHRVTFSFGETGVVGPTTFDISYSVWIVGAKSRFYDASIDTDVPGAVSDVTVTKDIFDEEGNYLFTLASLGGDPDGPMLFPDTLQHIAVSETFVLGANGAIFSATDTYTEVHAPEPASIALMGLGLAGMGVWRRRKA